MPARANWIGSMPGCSRCSISGRHASGTVGGCAAASAASKYKLANATSSLVMNSGSAKKPALIRSPTSRVTSRYMRLKQASPSVAGSPASMVSIRAIASSIEVTVATDAGNGAGISVTIRFRPEEAHMSQAGDVQGWTAEIAEIRRRRELALAMGGPEKIQRQRTSGRLTVRERIDRLADPDSFAEIGALTGFGSYDGDGRLLSILPANFVAGTARIDGRPVLLGADDFTVRGGSADAAIHAKQIYSEQYANEMRLPVVRLLDGASGGGSVKTTYETGFTYVPVNPGWDVVVDNLSVVPVVAACLGPTVGLGAARLVMSHLAVMVAGVGQLFTAGPPVVRGGTGEDLTKEELGGVAVHLRNGTIERFTSTEDEAFGLIRSFLSYLPHSVYELPPVLACDDPPDRRDESLSTAIPRNPRLPYRTVPILKAIFDHGSVFTYADDAAATE